jgi:hypothetical protein
MTRIEPQGFVKLVAGLYQKPIPDRCSLALIQHPPQRFQRLTRQRITRLDF